jgi:proteasome lid subunit RPN8/RPN11
MNKESFKTKNAKSILLKIKEWSTSNFSQEVCGLVGESDGNLTAFLCENKSISPRDSFSIDPMEYLLFTKNYKPVAVFHSHVVGDETESEKDIIMSENSCLPFFIYSLNTKKINIYLPKRSIANRETITNFKKEND